MNKWLTFMQLSATKKRLCGCVEKAYKKWAWLENCSFNFKAMTNFESKLTVFEQALNDLLSTIASHEAMGKSGCTRSKDQQLKPVKERPILVKNGKGTLGSKSTKINVKSGVNLRGKPACSQVNEVKLKSVMDEKSYPKKKCVFHPKSNWKTPDEAEAQTKEALDDLLFQNSQVTHSNKVSVDKLRKSIEEAVQVLKKNFVKLQNENTELKGKVTDLIDENDRYKRKLLKNICTRCKKDVNDTDDVISKLKCQVNMLKEEKAFLLNDLKDKEHKLVCMEHANKKWLSVLNSVLNSCDTKKLTQRKTISPVESDEPSDHSHLDNNSRKCPIKRVPNNRVPKPNKTSRQYHQDKELGRGTNLGMLTTSFTDNESLELNLTLPDSRDLIKPSGNSRPLQFNK